MSRVNKILIALIAIVLILITYKKCSQNTDSRSGMEIIPEDIAFVAALDIPKFLKKSQLEDIQQTDVMSNYLSEASAENPIFTDIIKEPLKSGIDFRRNTYYALDYDETNNKEHFAGLILSLKDAGKFNSLTKKHFAKNIKSGNGFDYITLDRVTIVGWNDDFVIFGSSDMFINLDEKMEYFFATEKENSIINNENFLEAINSGKDLSFWLHTTPYLNDKALLKSYGAGNIPTEVLEGNHITGFINFGKGEMEGDVSFDFKPEMDQVFKNYFNDNTESDFSKYIPKNNCGFAFSASLNLPGIYNYRLGDRELQNSVDRILATKGITTNELFRTFGGDMFAASYRERPGEKASLLCGTKYYNRRLLDEFLDLGVQAEYLIKESNDVYTWTGTSRDSSSFKINFPDGFPRLAVADDVVFFITDVKNYNRILDGGYNRNEMMSTDLQTAFKEKMVAGVFDMDVMTNTGNKEQDIFEKCTFSFDKKAMKFKLDFKNKDVYALKLLMNQGLKQ